MSNVTPRLQLHRVSRSYDTNTVLDRIDIEVRRGDVVTLIGPHGAGKSTLLRCAALLEPLDAGSVYVDGVVVSTAEPRLDVAASITSPTPRPQQIGLVLPGDCLFPNLNVVDNVALALRSVGGSKKEAARKQARLALRELGLGRQLRLKPAQLTPGQYRRVAIARTMAMEPDVLLLDDVTGGIPREYVGEVLEMIGQLKRDRVTMLIATHELSFAKEISDLVFVLDGGTVVEAGAPLSVLVDPRQRRTREFLARAKVTGRA